VVVTGRSQRARERTPRSARTVPDPEPDIRCAACGAPLATGQRYCLECGTRRGRLAVPAPLVVPPAPPAAARTGAAPAVELPEPRTMAALVLVTLAFGLFLGNAAGPGAGSAAAGRGPVMVVAGSPAPAATAQAPAAAETEPASTEPDTGGTTAVAAATPEPTNTAPATEPGDTSTPTPDDEPDDTPAAVPPIEHVAVVSLSGQDLGTAFAGDSPAPYLATDLRAQGALLKGYWAIDDSAVANGIALLSGQPPNADTRAGCPRFSDDCLAADSVPTVAGQLIDRGLLWRAYVGGLGGPEQRSCRAPEPGGEDPWREPREGDPYVTARNPFVYFRSILDASECGTQDVGLDSLEADLADASSTPQLLWIAPDACHDGSERACPDGAGGLAAADAFLREWVPKLQRAPAMKDAGIVVILFDTGPAQPSATDAEAPPGAAGANVGALVLGPAKWVTPGTESVTAFSHLSLLRTIEDAFGLEHLGDAARDDVASFGADVFAAWTPSRR
jgi:phosphatidylinositol-3-phosphatase